MALLLKAIYRFKAIPTKIKTQLFIELERAILKFIWNNKKTTGYLKIFSTRKGILLESVSLTSSSVAEQ